MHVADSAFDHSLSVNGRIKRVIRLIADARMRMYLRAVVDPATGAVDPELERSVVRLMAL